MDMKIFDNTDFGELRVLDADIGTLFCGKDVAVSLGYVNPRKALSDHCKGVTNRYPLQTAGGIQEFVFITEADVFRLIVSSKLPNAQVFESWIFEEVLPSIRQHGGYLTPDKIEEALTDPDTIIRLATTLKEERAKRITLEVKNAELTPKAFFADAVANSDTLILVRDLAKILKQHGYDTGGNRLFARLREDGYIEKNRNEPTQRSLELEIMRVVESTITKPDGTTFVTRTPKITGKGQAYFVKRYCKNDEVA